MGRNRDKAATLDRITRASVPVECGGKTYYFTPLALSEMGALEKWAQQEPYRKMRDKMAALGIDGSKPSPMLDKLLQQAEEQSADRSYLARQLESIAGITYAILLGFRVRHADMTDEKLAPIIEQHGFGFLRDLMEGPSYLNEAEAKKSEGVEATKTTGQ